jgi:hypothetical protein
MQASRHVHEDVRCSDHYLVWIKLGRTTRTTRKAKHVIGKWCLERFEDKEITLKYQDDLQAEVSGLVESQKRGAQRDT